MSKSRKKIYTILACLLALCLAAGLFACDGKSSETEGYGYGEEGIYYYPASEGADYMLTLRGGTYILTLESGDGSSGTYAYDPDVNSLTLFEGDEEKGSASLADGGMSVTWEGRTYFFLRYEYYTVSFVFGSETLSAQSVLNGRAASDPGDAEKDGYVFLGWYADSSFTERYGFDTAVTADTTVYARFEAIDYSVREFVVTYDFGDGETLETETINGRIYDLPEAEMTGYAFIGWWVSATNKSDELTYKYTDETLYEDTTLFAVYASGGYIGASVYDDRVTWLGSVGSTAEITIKDGDGETIGGATAQSSSGSLSYGFASLPAGKYTVEVTSGGVTETLAYVAKGLARVSGFEILSGDIFRYDPVENAERYYISVECGNENHDHGFVDNGSALYYDFSTCEMGPDGITFTVVAYADGYYRSVSSYSFFLGLDTPRVRVEGGVVLWDGVDHATEYEVYVDGVLAAVTGGTSWSLSEYGTGTYEIAVRAVTRGYWSERSETYLYDKTTLASPSVTGIDNYEISWTPVEGATGYKIRIGDRETTVEEGITSLYLTDENYTEGLDSYEISVKALAEDSANDSPYGEPVTVTGDEVGSAASYSDGVVMWQYSLRASEYVVTVNDGDEISVLGANSVGVALTKQGNNEIRIRFYDSDGTLYGEARVDVYAYAVVFDARGGTAYLGGEAVEVVYVAKGDTMTLPDVEYEGMLADFLGWYTLPDLTGDPDAASYGGDGTKYGDGGDTFVFGGNGTTVIYASWVNRRMQVTLDAGAGYLTGADGAYVEIPINGVNYSVPVPETDDKAFAFIGWYSGENGTGTRYTYEDGSACATFSDATVTTLYAYWAKILDFSLIVYNGETVLSVSKGSEINQTSVVTVPETYTIDDEEYTVKYIGSSAFNSCSSLEVLNVPDTLTYFDISNNGYASGNGALASSAHVREVNVYATGDEPDPTKEIFYYSADGVLFRMNNITEEVEVYYYPYGRTDETYEIPATVYNEYECAYDYTPIIRNVVTTSSGVFRDHKEFTHMTIPGSLSRLGPYAFYGCTALESVEFEKGVAYIDEYAFYNCTALVDVKISDTVKTISDRVFYGCTGLTSFTIPDNVETLGTYLFYNCSGLESVELSKSITQISARDFQNCTALKTVEIPFGISLIDEYAFYGCSSLYAVSMPYSLRNVGQYAFYNCAALERIEFPNSVETMGTYALGSCKALETVILSESLTEIVDHLFYADSALKNVNIPAGITSIGAYAFYSCTSLENMSIPSCVTSLGNYTFYGCSGFTEIVIPDSVTSLGTYLFYNCSSLTYVRLPAYITVINDNDFRGCSSLAYIEFPDCVTSINQYAFYQCYLLSGITLPASLTTIGASAFYGCFSLTTLTIPEDVSSIGSSAFSQCFNLVEIYNESTLDIAVNATTYGYIAYYAKNVYTPTEGESHIVVKDDFGFVYDDDGNYTLFEYVGEGNDLYMPEGPDGSAYDINRYAFYAKTWIETISIPSCVTAIGNYAFYNCTSLTKIYFNATAMDDMSSSNYAFYNAGRNETGITVYVGASVTRIPAYIFYPYNATYYPNVISVVFDEGSVCSSIGRYAFYACAALKEISIPDTCTSMETYAFYGCESLEYIYLPYGMTTLEAYVFRNCSSLDGVEIPGTVTEIGNYAFYYCLSLTSIVIPDSVTSLGTNVFFGCTSLKEVQLSKNLTSIGDNTFSDCTALVGIVIPEGVISIGKYAFSNCTALKNVSLYDSLLTIDNYAFEYDYSLTSLIIPSSVTTIGTQAFIGCYKLVEVYNMSALDVEIGSTANGYVGYYAKNVYTLDEGNTHLVNLEGYWFVFDDDDEYFLVAREGEDETAVLPGNVNGSAYEIYRYAFYGDETLTSVEIPESVTSIGNYAFYGTENLEAIYINASSLDDLSVNNYVFSNAGSNTEGITVYVGASVTRIPAYLFYPSSSTSPNVTKIVFEERSVCTEIGEYAFENMASLETIVLPEGLKTIGENAFYGCTSLKEIVIPDSVETIGQRAFYNCTSLESVEFGSELDYIGANAFYGCVLLDDIVLPENLTYIGTQAFMGTAFYDDEDNWDDGTLYMGKYLIKMNTAKSGRCSVKEGTLHIASRAFFDCTSITSVMLPSTLVSIGDEAFYGCTAIANINIPSGIGYIGSYAFYNCSSITDFVIPEGIGSIEPYTFYGCTALLSVTIPGSVTNIGDHAFYKCERLSRIDIPEGVTEIGNYAFAYCSSLIEMTLPDAVKEIPGYVFYDCTSLEGVTFADDITSIGDHAFYECESLTSLMIPSTVTEIVGTYAFYGCTSLEELYYNATYIEDLATSSYHFGRIGRDAETLVVYVGANVERIPANLFRGSASPYIGNVVFGKGSVCAEIGSYAFYDCSYMTEINIPDTVTSIGQYAFRGCSQLTSVTIPSGVTSIEQYTFYQCYALADVSIPEGVVSIGTDAFYSCYSLISVTIPSSVTDIGNSAFRYCYKLVEICNESALDIVAGSTDNGYIAQFALNVYSSASGESRLVYQDGFTFASDGSVWYLVGYFGSDTELILPSRVNGKAYGIYQYAFYGDAGIRSVTIPSTVTEIGTYAFYNCTSLENVALPEGLTEIASYLFYGCISLEYADIPSTVTEIGTYAFYNCTSLKSVTIPEGTASVGNYAFYGCVAVTTIYFDAVKMTDLSSSNRVFYQVGQSADGVTVYIGASVTKIPNYLFFPYSSATYSPNITSVIFAEGCVCEEIGNYAFGYVSSLTEVTIPSSVKTIGTYAFEYCTYLVTVNFSEGLTELGNDAFYNCNRLEAVNLPDTLVTIGTYVFYNNYKLSYIEIPDSVTTIGNYAFSGCNTLVTVVMGSGVTSIGNYAFNGCTGLTTVYYNGTEEQWNAISIGSNNTYLTNATIYFSDSNGISARVSLPDSYTTNVAILKRV